MEASQENAAATADVEATTDVETTAAIIPAPPQTAIVAAQDNNGKMTVEAKKKKRGMNLLRLALFMLRRGSKTTGKSKNSVQVDVASKGMWRSLVGSMRPLHLHDNQSPPHAAAITVNAADANANAILPDESHVVVVEKFEDVFPPPLSPTPHVHYHHHPYSPSCASTSSFEEGMSSRYASAVNLHEMDEEEEDEDCDDGDILNAGNVGDEMIDEKAEEFIAHFYEQMRLQKLVSRQGHHRMSR